MTLRSIPVDTARVQLVAATPTANAVSEWVEMHDGSRRPSGNQACEKHEDGSMGAPLWTVDCLIAGEERGTLVSVQIASHDQPHVAQFQPVPFTGLIARCTVGRDNKLRQYWSATGVGNGGKPAGAKHDGA